MRTKPRHSSHPAMPVPADRRGGVTPRMRYLDQTRPSIEENLALDEALLQEADETQGPPVLRFWELPTPAVVLGASCRLRQDVIVAACRADGVPIARRSSGGGTVVVGPGALNVTVVLPQATAPGLSAVDVAQRYVLDRLAEALRRLGPPVVVLGLGDLTVHDRKCGGSAQRRLRDYFMVHVSILYQFSLDLISRYTREPARQPSYRRSRPHGAFVMNLDLPGDRLRDAIRSAWLGPTPRAFELADVPEGRVRRLMDAKFNRQDWIERL